MNNSYRNLELLAERGILSLVEDSTDISVVAEEPQCGEKLASIHHLRQGNISGVQIFSGAIS